MNKDGASSLDDGRYPVDNFWEKPHHVLAGGVHHVQNFVGELSFKHRFNASEGLEDVSDAGLLEPFKILGTPDITDV